MGTIRVLYEQFSYLGSPFRSPNIVWHLIKKDLQKGTLI